MRIAIFGDIHANLEALQAVLADAGEQGCAAHACVGDIVGYNADPAACIELVRELGCPIVKGNHDDDAAGDHGLETMNPVASTALEWTRRRLGAEDREWLRKLRMVRQVHEFTLVHSTLDQPAHWNYVTNRFEAMSNFSYQFTQVCFHGHTHVPKVYVKSTRVGEIPPDDVVIQPAVKYFINVGSVGQPRDGDWRACYVVYDTDERRLMFRRVEYDIERTQRKVLDAGLPGMLAERLEEGR
jgi:diadenosine tetraphosphatase ApaH/serine/threonine PP2A family protein phosphatase